MRLLRSTLLLPLSLLLLIGGCNNTTSTEAPPQPEAIVKGDECHVCGMLITRFPGPKGEAFTEHQERPYKFCSTRDLFVWLQQPETEAIVEAIYVHDMAKSPWERPADEHLIPAETAWYVVGSGKRGAMGATLASFAERTDAASFAKETGGELLAYSAIDMQVLNNLDGPGAMEMDQGDMGQGDMSMGMPMQEGAAMPRDER